MAWLWPQAPGTPSSRSGTNPSPPTWAQAGSSPAHAHTTGPELWGWVHMPGLPPWATGPWVLLPYPGLVPPGGPHCGDKSGMEWGKKRKGRRALTLCCPGARASPLWRARGRRWKLQGLAFLNWFYFNFYYIFSFSIKEPLPTLYLVSLCAAPSPRMVWTEGCGQQSEALDPVRLCPGHQQCGAMSGRQGGLGEHTKFFYWEYLQEQGLGTSHRVQVGCTGTRRTVTPP